jgi:rhodanese-related sulfurtransferase
MSFPLSSTQELIQFSIPDAVHNPMSSFDFDAIPTCTDKKVGFFCAHGIRSRQVGQYLLLENRLSEAEVVFRVHFAYRNTGRLNFNQDKLLGK